ncbi:MAG: hypothetical protein WBC44_17295 [Planctomycetaceae bacterium]
MNLVEAHSPQEPRQQTAAKQLRLHLQKALRRLSTADIELLAEELSCVPRKIDEAHAGEQSQSPDVRLRFG